MASDRQVTNGERSGACRTPLWACHLALGARMVEFSGWALPVQYDGILAEHHRTRREASVFDTCHMGRFLLEGPGAAHCLSALVTADVLSMSDGRCRYGFLLNEQGGVLDDLIVYRFDAEAWMLVVNAGTRARDRDWIRARLTGRASLADVTDDMGKLDVQGPRAERVVADRLRLELAGLKRFHFQRFSYAGTPAVISRTGYTGEDGFEVYVDAAQTVGLWQALVAGGAKPAGLGARDTLRLEAGLPLYGHELSEAVTPLEAGLGRYAGKPDFFVGRTALEQKKKIGVDRRLRGLRIEGRQSARHGNAVLADGRTVVGQVTSGSFAPTLGCGIAMAYVDAATGPPGGRLCIDTGKKALEATIVDLPFYRREQRGSR